MIGRELLHKLFCEYFPKIRNCFMFLVERKTSYYVTMLLKKIVEKQPEAKTSGFVLYAQENEWSFMLY